MIGTGPCLTTSASHLQYENPTHFTGLLYGLPEDNTCESALESTIQIIITGRPLYLRIQYLPIQLSADPPPPLCAH